MQRALAVVLILLLAAALRLPGIHWGLPDATHPDYSFHPDEAVTVLWADLLRQRQIVPPTFQFGGTLNATMLNAYRRIGAALAPVLGGKVPLANTLLAGRYFILFLSLLTIVIVFEIGRLLFEANAGLLAALVLAVTPVHVFLVHNVRPDETGAFIASLIVYLAALILKAEPARDRRYFVYSGLTLGAALAFRFPLAAFGLSTLAAWLLRSRPSSIAGAARLLFDGRIAILVGMTILGYCVASPHTLIYWRDVVEGLQLTLHYETAAFPDAVGRGPGVFQYGWTQLQQGLGIPLHLLALAAVAHALLRRSREQLLLLAGFLPYFVLASCATWVVVRYTLPMMPVLALLIAAAIVQLARASRPATVLAGAATVAALCWTLLSDVAFARIETAPNVRDDVSRWITASAPAGRGIGTVREYTDDVHLNPVIVGDYRLYTVKTNATAPETLGSGDIDFLIVNEGVYGNLDRLGDRHPYPGVREFGQALAVAPYHLVREFKRPVRFAGLDFSAAFTSQDYVILNPGIRVYQHD